MSSFGEELVNGLNDFADALQTGGEVKMNTYQKSLLEAYIEGWTDCANKTQQAVSEDSSEIVSGFLNSSSFTKAQVVESEMKDNEVFMALLGGRIGKYWWGFGQWDSEGAPARVGFDWKLVQDREKTHGDVIGFWHTHPHFPATPSDRDRRTMGAWTLCFGRPLACCIEGIDGLKAHWYEDDEQPPVTAEIKRIGNLFFGIDPYF